jgi:hypothetical protein
MKPSTTGRVLTMLPGEMYFMRTSLSYREDKKPMKIK